MFTNSTKFNSNIFFDISWISLKNLGVKSQRRVFCLNSMIQWFSQNGNSSAQYEVLFISPNVTSPKSLCYNGTSPKSNCYNVTSPNAYHAQRQITPLSTGNLEQHTLYQEKLRKSLQTVKIEIPASRDHDCRDFQTLSREFHWT